MSIVVNEAFPTLAKEITRRAEKVRRAIAPHWSRAEPFRCIVAGGCLNSAHVNDVDLFPVGAIEVPALPLETLTTSHNAKTYDTAPWTIQVCAYRHETLEALIESFDFAHVQVGAELMLGGGGSDDDELGDSSHLVEASRVVSVAFTQDFVESSAAQTSWFIGSRYPLSSLIRAGKYYPDRMPRAAYIRAVVNALAATIARGFKDYDDFKDQIDAVDLGLLNDEQKEVGAADLQALFELLRKDK